MASQAHGKILNIRERRAERKREEILRAGLKVFAAKGFRAATMDDIALELEATKGLLYYHFKTKEEILEAILSENDLIEGIERGFAALPAMPVRQGLRQAIAGSLALMESNRELVRFLQVQALLSTAQAEAVYTKVLERLYDRAAEVLEGFKAVDEIRPEVSARDLGRMIVDLVASYFIQQQIFGERFQSESYLESAIAALLDGVATSRANP